MNDSCMIFDKSKKIPAFFNAGIMFTTDAR